MNVYMNLSFVMIDEGVYYDSIKLYVLIRGQFELFMLAQLVKLKTGKNKSSEKTTSITKLLGFCITKISVWLLSSKEGECWNFSTLF